MFDSFSGAEILTIAVIALVVFGPHRLPEIARTIGGYLRELRRAVIELRRGIEQEIGPIREPIEEIKQDISKPVSEVRQTLAKTADAAKSAEHDIRRSVKNPPTGQASPEPGSSAPVSGEGDKPDSPSDGSPENPRARWIAPEPPTGVSPSEVWEGMGDPMPESIRPPMPESDPGSTEAGGKNRTARDEDEVDDPVDGRDVP